MHTYKLAVIWIGLVSMKKLLSDLGDNLLFHSCRSRSKVANISKSSAQHEPEHYETNEQTYHAVSIVA